MAADPGSEIRLAPLSLRDGEHGDDQFRVACIQGVTVEQKKAFHRDGGCPLVAVQKGVVASDAVGIGSREHSDIEGAIGREIARPGQGRFQKGSIAQAAWAAMLGDVLLVGEFESLRFEPVERHLASSRRALRRFFITARSVSTCLATVGS